MARKLTTEEFIIKAKEKFGDTYDYSLVIYKNYETPIKIVCKTHGEFSQTPNIHLIAKCGCPKCSGYYKVSQEGFIERAKNVHGDKYDYSLVNYIHNEQKVKIICNIHGIFEQTPHSHISQKSGCKKCTGKYKETEEFVKRAKEVHGSKYDYSLVNYKSSKSKIKIICLTHGIFNQEANSHLKGNGCPCCKTSKGESAVKRFLVDNNILFKQQKTFKECRYKLPLPFDFYIPKHNICIEYDGKQHSTPIKLFGGQRGFELIQLKDKIKTDYCKNNNISLIRVRYDENIEKVLNQKLIFRK